MIALVRSRALPDFERDDDVLLPALDRVGLQGQWVVWEESAVDWSRFDAVWIRTTWDYTKKLEAFLAWAERASAASRLLNPLEVVRWNTDKRYLRDLETDGIPIAPSVWLDPGEDPTGCARERGWRQAFVKPVVGATAEGTLRFRVDGEGLSKARAHCLALNRPMILQPYLRSVEEEGEVSVILAGGKITHAVRKIPQPGDYRVQDDFGAVDQPLGLFQGEDAFARRALDAVQRRFDGVLGRRPPLVARVDMLRDDRGELVLNELELVEPSLFFRHAPDAADVFAEQLAERAR